MEAAQGQRAFQIAPMEETQFWKQLFKSRFHSTPSVLISPSPSSHRSWEEKAFAEDTAGPLGGSIWPPRSYSCNFCMREFRSAQALGGHMNVHRRDRARLQVQQSLIMSSHIDNVHDQNNPDRSLTAAKNKNKNKNNISRVSINKLFSIVEKKPEEEEKEEEEEDGSLYVETDLSMNSFIKSSSGVCSKRPKISLSSSESLCDIYSSSNTTSSGSTEEQLDLELRLGDSTKS